MTAERSKTTGMASKSPTIHNRFVATPEKLLELAPQILQEVEEGSPFFAANPPRPLPRFTFSEFTLGSELGAGSFGHVHEIVDSSLSPQVDPPPSSLTPLDKNANSILNDEEFNEMKSRKFVSNNILRDSHLNGMNRNRNTRYAMKRLIPTLDESDRVQGIVDIAIEARFLAALSHPNIVRIRGLAAGTSLSPDFFLVMDRLHEILSARIGTWRDERAVCSGRFCGLYGTDKKALAQLWAERLLVCIDITSGLRYLHKNNIVYRDLKPENIGFDVRGDVKIFDFGLAKELRPEDKKGENYNVTGRTGTLLYMAPEVATCQPYNLKADSYSFGLMMWEICALEEPFQFFTTKEVYQKVAVGGYRPMVQASWPSRTKKLMKSCWNALSSQRLTMEDCADMLRDDYVKYAAAAEEGGGAKKRLSDRSRHLVETSRRSMIFRLNELAVSAK